MIKSIVPRCGMEAHPEDLDKEVDGIAGDVAFGPAPIRLFDQKVRDSGQFEVTRRSLNNLQALFLEQRQQ